MDKELSNEAVLRYLPVIKAILASVEIGIAAYPEDKIDSLLLGHLNAEFGGSKILHATNIINLWLKDSPFEATPFLLKKRNSKAAWEDMVTRLRERIARYDTVAPIVGISLLSSGEISRNVDGYRLSHEFEGNSMKAAILRHLSESEDFVPTEQLRAAMQSKNKESILKIIPKINSAVEENLRLPKRQKLIETKRGSGHRINPAYHIICLPNR